VTTLFIADLHLSEQRPHIVELFLQFLREEAAGAEALYILGDLFEVWLGDDAVPPFLHPVVAALAALPQRGVPVYVMVGNRDFLLGAGFEALSGCTLLPDPMVIDLYGTPTLLMHGDTLCTDDVEYQRFRALVRSPQWQTDFLAKSVAERQAFAKHARAESRAAMRDKAEEIMDVNARAVVEAFRTHQVRRLIHGHTHRPAEHKLQIDDHEATRIVLGDWYEHSSVLRCDQKACRLS
jgi:UDP-2,3-diacylglucosamine hydrolase